MSQTTSGQESPKSGVYPELVMCLAAAVGTDTGLVTEALSSELRNVGYEPVPIRLSQLMSDFRDWSPCKTFERKIVESGQACWRAMQSGASCV